MNNIDKIVKVNQADFPVSCPTKETPSWDMHPRVYIEMSDEKGGDCPYCGCHFEMSDD